MDVLKENNDVVGILYICTGKYSIFWDGFYQSCEKYFLPDIKKKYFVFTDKEKISNEENVNVEKIYQKNLGWPENTLFRFKMFRKSEKSLHGCKYLFFFNANIKFLKRVESNILPRKGELLVVNHPGFFNKSNVDYTYERNSCSEAYIPLGEGQYYVFGAVNGGETSAFMKLIYKLDENIDKDYKKNIIAIWHDESHLNHYIYRNENYKILDPSYAYPEDWDIPFEPRILILDKNKFGGHQYLRNK